MAGIWLVFLENLLAVETFEIPTPDRFKVH